MLYMPRGLRGFASDPENVVRARLPQCMFDGMVEKRARYVKLLSQMQEDYWRKKYEVSPSCRWRDLRTLEKLFLLIIYFWYIYFVYLLFKKRLVQFKTLFLITYTQNSYKLAINYLSHNQLIVITNYLQSINCNCILLRSIFAINWQLFQ